MYGMPKYLPTNIAAAGYKEPTRIQMQAIPAMAKGRELLCVAPTGSGKTAAFLIPTIARMKFPSKGDTPKSPRALIVLPTRELAQQTYREVQKLIVGRKFRVAVLTKATGAGGGVKERRLDILISTPLRLVALMNTDGVDLDRVETLIFDEADKLFEMGFVEQVDTIVAGCTNTDLQRVLFSATLPQSVEELARSVLHDPIRIIVGRRGAATEDIKQSLLFVGQEAGKILAVRQHIRKGIKPPVIIFVQSKDRAQQLFRELVYDGLNVDVIHSGRTQAQRDQVVQKFRNGKVWILIATDLMARGMDFKGVNLVINYDFPQSVTSYIHRIGRTGRAGRSGEAVTYFTEDDTDLLRSIAHVIKASGCDVPDWMFTLKKASQQKKNELKNRVPHRRDISQTSRFDANRMSKKKSMIAASKKKNAERED